MDSDTAGDLEIFRYQLVKVAALKAAPFNPSVRLKEKVLRELRDSIENIGLIYPIVITKQREIVDGHRRVAVFRQLGRKHIPAIVSEHGLDIAYANLNSTAKRLTGNAALSVWLKNPHAVMGRSDREFSRAAEVVGEDMLKVIASHGLSISTYIRARTLMNYCGHPDRDSLRACIRWMIKTGFTFRVALLMVTATPPARILAAIKEGRPLKVEFTET